ncbi:MAG: nucleotidyltransferase domain-containing protein [Gemmatimonadetes bacterium]|nr:nucleotidyltransferase domain-containing protein [Gemmatimonadota bacterium]
MSVQGILDRRRAQRQELLDRAESYVAEVEARFPVRRAVVFGSVARGDFNLWSDIDLLLVIEGMMGNPLERMDAVEPRPPLVQPVIWTPEEWHAQRARGNQIVRDASAQGEWLRGSPADP